MPSQNPPSQNPPSQAPSRPGPSSPAFDPQKKFAETLARMYLLRTYQVPKPSGSGTNRHSEEYAWCTGPSGGRMAHYYEGIAYIYKSAGPYTVVSGEASADGSTGRGVIRYTQEQANFQEEVGKVHDIQISWTGDVATVTHPEIGTNDFAKSLRSSDSCT